MSDVELRDELMTLLTAGHETTATGLSWAFERLMRTPRVMERLVELARRRRVPGRRGEGDAARAAGDRGRGPQAHARDRGRRVHAARGHAGAARDRGGPRAARPLPEPDEFRPERFIDGQPESYAWIPFGGGVRRCIGASFAQMEMRVVLREVLRRVRLQRALGTAGAPAGAARDRGARARRARGGDRAAGLRPRRSWPPRPPGLARYWPGTSGRDSTGGAGWAAGGGIACPPPPSATRQTLFSSLCAYQRPTGEISSSRMKITGPLAGRSTPAVSWERWIRPLVVHSDTIAGTMMSAPA